MRGLTANMIHPVEQSSGSDEFNIKAHVNGAHQDASDSRSGNEDIEEAVGRLQNLLLLLLFQNSNGSHVSRWTLKHSLHRFPPFMLKITHIRPFWKDKFTKMTSIVIDDSTCFFIYAPDFHGDIEKFRFSSCFRSRSREGPI
jgi:hypothetical protein